MQGQQFIWGSPTHFGRIIAVGKKCRGRSAVLIPRMGKLSGICCHDENTHRDYDAP